MTAPRRPPLFNRVASVPGGRRNHDVLLPPSLRRRVRGFLRQLPLTYRPNSAPPGPLREVLHTHNRTVLAHHGPFVRGVGRAAAAIVWPAFLLIAAARALQANHRTTRALSGRSSVAQAGDLLRLGWTQNARPSDYYYFNWWQRGCVPADFLTDGRVQQLLRTLNRGADTRALDDKLRFHDLARTHGLATVPVFARIGREGVDCFVEPSTLQQDLVIKPCRGRRSRGLRLWSWDVTAAGYRARAEAPPLTWAQRVDRLRASAGPGGVLVQPFLRSHPTLAALTHGALCTVRIITAIDLDGKPSAFSAIVNFPPPASLTSDGGVAAPVDLATGQLRVFLNTDPGHPPYALHPITGVPAVNCEVPAWNETLTLALRAHAHLPQIAFIGWDIALTDKGPLILEGNHGIGVNTHQIAPNPPLGRTRFPELVLHHFRTRSSAA